MIRMVRNKLSELLKKEGYGEVLERDQGRPKGKKKPGHTYRKLAKEIGISNAALHQMIHGRKTAEGKYEDYNPSLEMLDRLCKFFGCKVGDILVYEED